MLNYNSNSNLSHQYSFLPKDIQSKYQQMGFSYQQILNAYQSLRGLYNDSAMLDALTNQQIIVNPSQLYTLPDEYNPEDLVRTHGIPVGLKNVGNTCYFNALIQSYFMNVEFVKEIIQFEEPNPQNYKNLQNAQRIEASIQLVLNLRKLFAQMILSDLKFVDPSAVIHSIVDDYGNKIQIGQQEDIGEFNLIFIARIEEALINQEKYKKNHYESQNDKQMIENSHDLHKNSIITSQFIGKTISFIEYQEDNYIFQKQKHDEFSIINLDLQHKNLYDSWNQSFQENIDDYKISDGTKTNATKVTSIKRAPGTLFFQLNRVLFDKQQNKQVKNNDLFLFEKEIYIDRFLHQNMELHNSIKKQIKDLLNEQKQLQDCILDLENYGDKNINLKEMIEQCYQFFEIQLMKKPNTIPYYFGQDMKQVQNILPLLNNYKDLVSQRISENQIKINKIKQTIDQTYAQLMQKNKYQLLSILIHDGFAETGHYYAFIFDNNLNQWFRYNDIHVSTETEEQVLKEAFGNYQNKGAYYLIYIQKNFLGESTKNLKVRSLSISTYAEEDQLKNLVRNNPDLFKYVLTQNADLASKVKIHQVQSKANEILDLYQQRFQQNNTAAREYRDQNIKNKNIPPNLKFFSIYLKNHENNLKTDCYEDMIKFHILSSSYRELFPNSQFENLLFNDEQLFNQIKNQIQQISSFKQPRMHNLNIDCYDNLKNEFIQMVQCGQIAQYQLQKAIDDDYTNCLYALDINQIYCGKVKNFLTILTKDMAFHISQLVQQKSYTNIIELLEIFTIYFYKFQIQKSHLSSTFQSQFKFQLLSLANQDIKYNFDQLEKIVLNSLQPSNELLQKYIQNKDLDFILNSSLKNIDHYLLPTAHYDDLLNTAIVKLHSQFFSQNQKLYEEINELNELKFKNPIPNLNCQQKKHF